MTFFLLPHERRELQLQMGRLDNGIEKEKRSRRISIFNSKGPAIR
jgi:hypothetical protein